MSDMTYTPTRQTAQSAMQKAQDAYSTARQAMEVATGLRARIEALEAENALLHDRLLRLEEPARVTKRRVA